MQLTTDLAQPPLYSPRQVFWAGFCGGPLAPVYLLSRNFRSLGQTEEERRYLMIGLALCIFALVVLVMLPARLSTGVFIGGAFAGSMLARQAHFWGQKVPPQGTPLHSNWRVFFSTLASFAAWAAAVVVLTLTLSAAGFKLP
ncbi:MAG: hypothetical protein V4679_22520 [Pseudomonadota bacterium]